MRDAATRQGPGRMLIAVYGIFALAATSRSAVQLATRFDQAPVAYLLSALAAVVYVLATVALARGSHRVALVACGVELAGVVVVGLVSLLVPRAFPDATVWSSFGIGYGFIPLVLPVLGLLWLRRTA
ncbi:hypothetical protein SAMN05216188_12847 [Lentzea xinjiangensis]|uniref:Integral membrane protein n=1 Tax=Lentzea xinjiangensis TaxID=402600 RepID=A0A1H9VV06_9PSEU|nr:hypothetical protein [Lentzea xinjiangensis]SES25596.1 hypothetical protein SAMN05216188_12847 [Lentzea xinjiangensis]